VKDYEQQVRDVIEVWGDQRATEVDGYEVESWSVRETPGASKRRKQIIVMKSAFKLARRGERPFLPTNPVADVAMPPARPKPNLFLDWDQLEDLAEAMATHGGSKEDYSSLICGIRIEEAARLNVEDVIWSKKQLFVAWSKTGAGRDRWVPMDEEVMAMLSRTPGPLWRSPTGLRLNSHNWREREWNPVIQKPFGKTKWKDLTPHDLRHTAASLAIDTGADANKVANMLGHTDGSFTLRAYAHLFHARVNDVQDKMLEARQQARHERLQRALERSV